MSSNHFYVYVLSNVTDYAENKTNNFRYHLPIPIRLDAGNWVVGLQNIIYSYSWNTFGSVDPQWLDIQFDDKGNKQRLLRAPIPRAAHKNVEELKDFLQTSILAETKRQLLARNQKLESQRNRKKRSAATADRQAIISQFFQTYTGNYWAQINKEKAEYAKLREQIQKKMGELQVEPTNSAKKEILNAEIRQLTLEAGEKAIHLREIEEEANRREQAKAAQEKQDTAVSEEAASTESGETAAVAAYTQQQQQDPRDRFGVQSTQQNRSRAQNFRDRFTGSNATTTVSTPITTQPPPPTTTEAPPKQQQSNVPTVNAATPSPPVTVAVPEATTATAATTTQATTTTVANETTSDSAAQPSKVPEASTIPSQQPATVVEESEKESGKESAKKESKANETTVAAEMTGTVKATDSAVPAETSTQEERREEAETSNETVATVNPLDVFGVKDGKTPTRGENLAAFVQGRRRLPAGATAIPLSDSDEPVADVEKEQEQVEDELEVISREVDDLGDEEFLKLVKAVRFEFLPDYGRFQVHFDDQRVQQIGMSKQAGYLLGFKNPQKIVNQEIGEYAPDLSGGYTSFAVYFHGLTEGMIVGNTQSSLLRVVAVTGKYGSVIEQTYDSPIFLRVLPREIHDMHVEIRTLDNRPVPFQWGDVIICLVFKKIITF